MDWWNRHGSGLASLYIKGTLQLSPLPSLRIGYTVKGSLSPATKAFEISKHHNIQKIKNTCNTKLHWGLLSLDSWTIVGPENSRHAENTYLVNEFPGQ